MTGKVETLQPGKEYREPVGAPVTLVTNFGAETPYLDKEFQRHFDYPWGWGEALRVAKCLTFLVPISRLPSGQKKRRTICAPHPIFRPGNSLVLQSPSGFSNHLNTQ